MDFASIVGSSRIREVRAADWAGLHSLGRFLRTFWWRECGQRGFVDRAGPPRERLSRYFGESAAKNQSKKISLRGTRCEASSRLAIDLCGNELRPEGLRLGAATQSGFDIACQESVEQVVGQEGRDRYCPFWDATRGKIPNTS
jgi:hypothetical protein